MSHLIDESNARYNVAYQGEVPWHGHGQKVDPKASVDEWAKAGGLDHEVYASRVEYLSQTGKARSFSNRKVLYRSDTNEPLSIVSDSYKIVQPKEVLEFFRKLVDSHRMEIDTVGSLKGGKVVWAQAKYCEGMDVVDGDKLEPRVLFATSYDRTCCTTAKHVATRVVCANTISIAFGEETFGIAIPHSNIVDISKVRLEMGLAASKWEDFMLGAKRMASTMLNDNEAELVLVDLLPVSDIPVRDTKAYKAIIRLFDEGSIGSDIPGVAHTAWDLLNCVTQYVDHERGSDKHRLHSAWFGDGDKLKSEAYDTIHAFCAA